MRHERMVRGRGRESVCVCVCVFECVCVCFYAYECCTQYESGYTGKKNMQIINAKRGVRCWTILQCSALYNREEYVPSSMIEAGRSLSCSLERKGEE